MQEVEVNLKDRSYPIIIQTGLLDKLPQYLSEFVETNRLTLITDSKVGALYGQRAKELLLEKGFEVLYVEIEEGEKSKQLSVYEKILRKIVSAGMDRKSALVALGGGVVGDLGGFVAATYMRGIDYIQVPTTLLAQTDSSVGGKVGVNLPEGKNLVGAFYQPKCVLIDPSVLRTLAEREFLSGLGEIVKYALIRNEGLWELLEKDGMDRVMKMNLSLLEKIIHKSCAIKAEIVAKDEREAGLRRILNFGHTPAHALEAITGFNYFRHGEAVIWGMRSMCELSLREKLISEIELTKIENLLNRMPIPPIPEGITVDDMMKYMKADKKRSNDKLYLVLLSGIGATKITADFSATNLRESLKSILDLE